MGQLKPEFVYEQLREIIHEQEDKINLLVEACERALACLEHSDPPEGGYTDRVCKHLRTVIAKANP